MSCITENERSNRIVLCIPRLRRFRYKRKYYFVESVGLGMEICNINGDGIFIEDYNSKTKRKFYKELTKGM